MGTERFEQLWNEVKNIMNYNISILVGNEKSDIVNSVNSFYKHNVLDNLWFTENFACDYSQYVAILKADYPEKFEDMKCFLYENTEILSRNRIDDVIKGSLLSGAVCTFIYALLKKNLFALIVSLGFGSLWAFLNEKQKEKFLNEVGDIVAHRLDEIGEEVKKILNRQ